MIPIIIKYDSKNVERRLKRITTKLASSTERSVRDTGIYLRDMMYVLTPKDTGMTAGSIMIKDISKTKTGASLSVSQRYIPVKNGSPMFNLLKWMLESKKAIKGWHAYGNPEARIVHFKNGNIKGLQRVIPDTAKRFGLRIRNDVNQIIK